MKLYAKNALFSLRLHISISDDIITGIASGTAICLRALPIPVPLKIKQNAKLLSSKNNESGFFENLEKLSRFYIEQGFNSDYFCINTPNYFIQQDERRKQINDSQKIEDLIGPIHYHAKKDNISPRKYFVEEEKVNSLF